ncbi:MAG: tRNA (cytosine(32)/uridine(32)-2'-O)-methyltransferase TrmJ [Gammaproteobacteria bacterium RBG_16_57_12]|nr:MAG: tRNA (cytosine(32)/uridine(32)-2'-O)-methyltransferase TrmJ [Gammaproteobacteria bacterium RBG_16_57_12]
MKLDNIRLVLMETSHPGNIGGCARAMKNMSLERLYLVNPLYFPDPDADARAVGAIDVLERAVVCASLQEAVQDCAVVVGTSARHNRRIGNLVLDPKACAERIALESEAAQVALVFGREHSGLSNEELGLCNYLLTIPCNEAFSSLNLAAALQVVCYELFMQTRRTDTDSQATPQGELATGHEMDLFYQHMEQALVDVEFIKAKNPRKTMRRLRRLYNRAQLEKMELAILRGIFNAMQKLADRGR